jgi:tetratricopeptide (TPR) repeat protein
MAIEQWRRAGGIGLLLIGPLFVASAKAQSSQADVQRQFEQATQLHQSGDLEGAIQAYQAILAAHPELADVRSNLGAAYARVGKYEQAIEQYKQALSSGDANQAIRFNLAMAYYKEICPAQLRVRVFVGDRT